MYIELISVFRGTKKDYIKVVAHVDKVVPILLKEGWVKEPSELPDCEQNDIELLVIEAETKEEIEALLKSRFGVELDKRGSLDTVKEKALAVINESKRVD